MTDMWQLIKKIDRILDEQVPFLLLLLLVLVLRLPNIVEPYWYGDEAIYLTIGVALRQGEHLYSQIVDHKTPLIYYLAMVPNQFWFRILNISCSMISTIIFYCLTIEIFKKRWVAWIATVVFITLTCLPALEGNIPNGELFVMFFVLIGAWFLSRTTFFQPIVDDSTAESESLTSRRTQNMKGHTAGAVRGTRLHLVNSLKLLFAAGCCFGLGILTKVPGLFDVAAFLSIGWYSLATLTLNSRFKYRKLKQELWHTAVEMGAVILGIVTPIMISILYFWLRGSGKDYLDYGLLYNFHYATSWQLSFTQKWLLFLFSLPGKTLLLLVWILSLTTLRKHLHPRFQFIATWFGLDLFACLLSNRPYPHYYLQLIPAVALLVGHVLSTLPLFITLTRRSTTRAREIFKRWYSYELAYIFIALIITWATVSLLDVQPYPTVSYYTRFWQLTTHQITPEAYRQSFNEMMKDDYEASKVIITSSDQHLFIWGTNPMLYSLTQKSPVGRFTVLFHIRDLHAEKETVDNFIATQPQFAVIMKGEDVPPELYPILDLHYFPDAHYQHFVLWRKLPS